MGRPDPSVLFVQTFVHSQLNEYVDEVLFSEPVVLTACEFLEQNASPSVPTVSFIGATSPPSFALEVFVHCEGEPRFRRICPAFLYSHSSSNYLEVEAVVTNHLVVRGSYRSLTLVVYGNTAEDLGQFNVDLDIDTSLVNEICTSSEERVEDLPPALCLTSLPFEDSLSSFKLLSFPFPEMDLSDEMKGFLQLALKICHISISPEIVSKVVHSVVLAVSSYVKNEQVGVLNNMVHDKMGNLDHVKDQQLLLNVLATARYELLELFHCHHLTLDGGTSELKEVLETKEPLITSEQLVCMYNLCFAPYENAYSSGDLLHLSQNKGTALQWGLVLLLCSTRESCFQFVTGGGMEQILNIFRHEIQRSTASILMLLGVIECATRHAIGCEGFLGWWPREDDNVPVGKSDGYCHLLSLLLQNQRHDIASLSTYILHRLRSYEIACKYECAVLSLLENLSSLVPDDMSHLLFTVNITLKKLLKLISFSGIIEESSPMTIFKDYMIDQADGLLSYKATSDFIASSKCSYASHDVDTHLLSLLEERGFLALSAALLSSPVLRSTSGHASDIFLEIASSIELIILILLRCRSGLTFLLLQPECVAVLILSLRGAGDLNQDDCLTLRDATLLISKGFFCRPEEVGMLTELHLRVVTTVDRLLATTTHSEEQLWLIWELCTLSRSNSGRQALLAIGYFPEALSVLLESLRSFKDLETLVINGSSPLNVVAFHCSAEILEVLVTDSTASSLNSWIPHAVELHKALHSSSPGSNRKDAPARLLEWIDAGVVYHKNGATGLLRYAAILASGGDAQLTSATILVSDCIDAENVVGDSLSSSDSQIIDSLLGKLISDKYFDGVTLGSTSVVQLTTAFRILAFVSENPVVAASLFEEGAITLLYVVLVNCKFMFERSSNNYDYLVDEGAECNSSSDLLLERRHEQSLVDLLIPSLVLLINILRNLQGAIEQYRNTKLLTALLKLHREISPKVSASSGNSSPPYPTSTLGQYAVCRLLVSALACWPCFGWVPGLFHCLLESVQVKSDSALASELVLGPKDACSLFCLLGDLFPEEGIWLWKNEMPTLSALRTLSVGAILGCQGESYVNWYLSQDFQEELLGRLSQELDKIAETVLHFSPTALDVIQDMLRVFIVRVSCQRAEYAVYLMRPVTSWIHNQLNGISNSEANFFKVYSLLNFLAALLEHPSSKALLLKEGLIQIVIKVLERCFEDSKLISNSRYPGKTTLDTLSWIIPVFKSLSLILHAPTSMGHSSSSAKGMVENFPREEHFMIMRQLLMLCQVLPVGRELLACLACLDELASSSLSRNLFVSFFGKLLSVSVEAPEQEGRNNSASPDDTDWRESPPLLNCCRNLAKSLDAKDSPLLFSLESTHVLTSFVSHLSMYGKSLEGLKHSKFLFGLPYDAIDDIAAGDILKDVSDMIELLDQKIIEGESFVSSYKKMNFCQVKKSLETMLKQLRKSACSPSEDADVESERSPLSTCADTFDNVSQSPGQPPPLAAIDEESMLFCGNAWKLIEDREKIHDISLGDLSEKFIWERPDSSVDRLMASAVPGKRKLSSTEGSNRRARDNVGFETVASNQFSRGVGASSTSAGPSRRDTFRQRKPNTSRPPSMHVDDYVARERNIDGLCSNVNVIGSTQRGSNSGRPPSIHVDEFMARQRERQNPVAAAVGDVTQVSNAPENGGGPEKSDTSRKLRAELDDDLQEIDIVFDEESESDDRLPFPQPDDNLQPASVITGESSPVSIVGESEGDTNDDSRAEFPSRASVSNSETAVTKEGNILLEKSHLKPKMKKTIFHEQSDESKYGSPVTSLKGLENLHANNSSGSFSNLFNMPAPSPVLSMADSRMSPGFYSRDSPQQAPRVSVSGNSHGYYEQRVPVNQPPLPPMPPPMSSVTSSIESGQRHRSPYAQNARDAQPPLPSGYPLHAHDVGASSTLIQSEMALSASSSYLASLPIAQPTSDLKHPWATFSSGNKFHEASSANNLARSLPPLPPMPPPFSSSPMAQIPVMNMSSQSSLLSPQLPLLSNDPRLGLFPSSGSSPNFTLSPFTPSLMLPRPISSPAAIHGSPTQQHGQNAPNVAHIPNPVVSVQSTLHLHPPPPPPPPQHSRPSHLPEHLRPSLQGLQTQPELVASLQQSTIQLQSLQVPQQIQIPPVHVYYQTQQQESRVQVTQSLPEEAQVPKLHGQCDSGPQQQQDSGMMLQQYFSSPEAIQSLLSDRDKLCQLLEQHPKLMQMLQERLGQL